MIRFDAIGDVDALLAAAQARLAWARERLIAAATITPQCDLEAQICIYLPDPRLVLLRIVNLHTRAPLLMLPVLPEMLHLQRATVLEASHWARALCWLGAGSLEYRGVASPEEGPDGE